MAYGSQFVEERVPKGSPPSEPRPPLVEGVVTLAQPRDPDLLALMRLWELKRGSRMMPSRSDFDPAEFKTLMPNIFLADILPPPAGCRFRVVGEELVEFHGQPMIGKTLNKLFEPKVAVQLNQLLDAVVKSRAVLVRAGKAYWVSRRAYREYQSCYLPLSADGHTVNMILGAMKFPPKLPTAG